MRWVYGLHSVDINPEMEISLFTHEMLNNIFTSLFLSFLYGSSVLWRKVNLNAHRFEVFTVVKIEFMVFWVVLCNMVVNIGVQPPYYMVQQHRRLEIQNAYSLCWFTNCCCSILNISRIPDNSNKHYLQWICLWYKEEEE